ncbi:hypothetical protein M0R45_013430 [Rubus argutus]|uniref:Uncharacterized protein n=1 Tax=Rubus argutus TaxID=59490 RepID=A0AAW1XL28_RUBAR
MQVTEVGHLGHYQRQVSDQVIVDVQNMEASELGEFRQERAVDNVVGEIEESEPRDRRDLEWDQWLVLGV